MRETKFTPGPWSAQRAIKPDNTGGYDFAVMDARGKIVAEAFEHVGLSDGSLASMRLPAGAYDARPVAANAALIAAAPDLYEALKGALPLVAKWCHTQGDNTQFHEETLAPIRAALAKACPTPETVSGGNTGEKNDG